MALCACLLSGVVVAQQSDAKTQTNNTPEQNAKQTEPASPITLLGSEYLNGIKLLSNRFRIDYTVDEITMVFFREFGSAPVVLVKPDGKKIFQSQADGVDLFWYDTATYDMISMKKPTPGPWQAVGQILPDSRVMVISDVALHAEPLPKVIFSGEILKQTAYLTNQGKPIDYTAFRDVVELTIEFVSTNNPNYNNFGSDNQLIATFEDNGKGMDERPLDGIFTGQFNLSIADGEWTPVFSVSTPMFSREQVDPVLRLLPNPIKISVELDQQGKGFHKLLIDAERQYVDMSTLLLDGKVRFPNGDIQNFSITDMSSDVREFQIVNYEPGVYRVKLTAYGNTVDGREFILDVPEFSFLAEAPKPPEPLNTEASGTPSAEEQNSVGQASDSNSPDSTETSLPETDSLIQPMDGSEEPPGMDRSTLYIVVVLVNLVILLAGGLGIAYVWQKRRKQQKNAEVGL